MKLPATDSSGVWLEYWAMDSNGYQSDHYWVKFRAVQAAGYGDSYYYDVIGDAFPDEGAYGSDVWYTFPAVGQPLPAVLQKVPSSEHRSSHDPLSPK